jgi:hypothetical protein
MTKWTNYNVAQSIIKLDFQCSVNNITYYITCCVSRFEFICGLSVYGIGNHENIPFLFVCVDAKDLTQYLFTTTSTYRISISPSIRITFSTVAR